MARGAGPHFSGEIAAMRGLMNLGRQVAIREFNRDVATTLPFAAA